MKLAHAAQLAFAVGFIGSFGVGEIQKRTIAEPRPNLSPAVVADSRYQPDTLSDQDWWIFKVKALATDNQGQKYTTCLFGDSISSGLKDSLQPTIMNFAMGGLSTVSLTTQLKYLNQAGIRCQKAIVAIGTNDAWYITSNDTFVSKLHQSLDLVRQMGAKSILLVPAFYSTVPASKDPTMAGPLQRVDEINALMQQVAAAENVGLMTSGLEPLYRNHALKDELTTDGVHLNENGNQIYRKALFAGNAIMP